MSKWRRGYPCPPLLLSLDESLKHGQDMSVKTWTFMSYFAPTDTFGRHKDEEDVLIVGVKGRTSYRFDTNACETCMSL